MFPIHSQHNMLFDINLKNYKLNDKAILRSYMFRIHSYHTMYKLNDEAILTRSPRRIPHPPQKPNEQESKGLYYSAEAHCTRVSCKLSGGC